MALLPEPFDTDNEQPAQPRELLPAAWYQVAAVESDVGPTKTSTKEKPAARLSFIFDIIDGVRKGRKIFTGFNLVNPNPKAVQISKGELKSLCDAAGLRGALIDSDALHGRPIDVLLKIDPPRVDKKTGTSYGAKNEVSGYAPAGSRSNDPENITLQGRVVAEPQILAGTASPAAPAVAQPPSAVGGSGAAPAQPAPAVAPAPVAAAPAQNSQQPAAAASTAQPAPAAVPASNPAAAPAAPATGAMPWEGAQTTPK